MNANKQGKLRKAGYNIGSADELLGLSAAESQIVNMRLILSELVRSHRKQRDLTQVQLAKILGSSQSRVAKIEAADPSVSIDLLLSTAFSAGASLKEVGTRIANGDIARPLARANSRNRPVLALH